MKPVRPAKDDPIVMELVDEVRREGEDDLDYPCINFIVKSGLGQRNSATV